MDPAELPRPRPHQMKYTNEINRLKIENNMSKREVDLLKEFTQLRKKLRK